MDLKPLVKKLKLARRLVSWKHVEEVMQTLQEIEDDKLKSHKDKKDKDTSK
jgi:hypothetical protein